MGKRWGWRNFRSSPPKRREKGVFLRLSILGRTDASHLGALLGYNLNYWGVRIEERRTAIGFIRSRKLELGRFGNLTTRRLAITTLRSIFIDWEVSAWEEKSLNRTYRSIPTTCTWINFFNNIWAIRWRLTSLQVASSHLFTYQSFRVV